MFERYRVIDLSVPLKPGATNRRLAIRPFTYTDGTTMHEIDTMSHIGTHVEMPSHFLPGTGKDVAAFPPDVFIGPGRVLKFAFDEPNLPIGPAELEVASGGDVRPGDIVFLTSSHNQDGQPYLSAAGAEWLRSRGIKLIGFDNSVAVEPPGQMTTHQAFLAHDVPIIENLANLDQVPDERVFFIALPWYVHDLDASPLRAVALIPES